MLGQHSAGRSPAYYFHVTFVLCSGGAAMLGLGDIVMPGLLLSFAARFDYESYLSLKSGYASRGIEHVPALYTPAIVFLVTSLWRVWRARAQKVLLHRPCRLRCWIDARQLRRVPHENGPAGMRLPSLYTCARACRDSARTL